MCGCGEERELTWEEVIRELERVDNDPDQAPIEVTKEFERVEKREEVEAE